MTTPSGTPTHTPTTPPGSPSIPGHFVLTKGNTDPITTKVYWNGIGYNVTFTPPEYHTNSTADAKTKENAVKDVALACLKKLHEENKLEFEEVKLKFVDTKHHESDKEILLSLEIKEGSSRTNPTPQTTTLSLEKGKEHYQKVLEGIEKISIRAISTHTLSHMASPTLSLNATRHTAPLSPSGAPSSPSLMPLTSAALSPEKLELLDKAMDADDKSLINYFSQSSKRSYKDGKFLPAPAFEDEFNKGCTECLESKKRIKGLEDLTLEGIQNWVSQKIAENIEKK